VVKKQPVGFDSFVYAFDDNGYLHKPSQLVLTSKELNRLFPRATWPTLNGVVRRPSNFIRRYQRVMYLADELKRGADHGERRGGKASGAAEAAAV
jgi:hypothetical protein